MGIGGVIRRRDNQGWMWWIDWHKINNEKIASITTDVVVYTLELAFTSATESIFLLSSYEDTTMIARTREKR